MDATSHRESQRARRGRLLRLLPMIAALLVAMGLFGIFSLDWGSPKVSPPPNPPRRQRIGYIEGGPYVEYPQTLRSLVGGLVELGWMKPIELPAPSQASTREMWQHLARHTQSRHIEFVEDAWWSGDWSDARRSDIRHGILQRLNSKGDIDLMLAMGTAAGQDLRDGHHTPTIVLSSSDPIAAGIIDSAKDSGRDYLWAECDPDKYIRQIHAFHNIVGFKRLGVISDDSDTGRIYANIPDLKQVAEASDFELVIGTAEEENITAEESRQLAHAEFARLAPHVDAFWVTDHIGTQPQFMPDVIKPLLDHNLPTWSPVGPQHVRRGVLFGTAYRDADAVGRFCAKAIARILNGERPRDIPQVFKNGQTVVVNREVARRIGFKLPPGLVIIADEVYDTIEGEHSPPDSQE
jgi:ABC-type uncharacterized transport system substrate-binding protein